MAFLSRVFLAFNTSECELLIYTAPKDRDPFGATVAEARFYHRGSTAANRIYYSLNSPNYSKHFLTNARSTTQRVIATSAINYSGAISTTGSRTAAAASRAHPLSHRLTHVHSHAHQGHAQRAARQPAIFQPATDTPTDHKHA